jgi:hypothetical protein
MYLSYNKKKQPTENDKAWILLQGWLIGSTFHRTLKYLEQNVNWFLTEFNYRNFLRVQRSNADDGIAVHCWKNVLFIR